MSENKPHLIADGSNYLFRSYYGVPEAANYKGVKVNAVYGFFAILRRVASSLDPYAITVVFDSQTGIVGKIDANPDYKATRELVDTGMYVQLPFIKRILERCQIRWIEPPDHEADDVIGSLAYQVASHGRRAFISSNDFDFAQLISPRVTLVRDVKGQAVQISKDQFIKEWGFTPPQYLDYLSIKGDSSDNIGGISGIGPKTARDLIIKYGSLPSILEHCDELPSRLSSKLKPETKRLLSNLDFLRIHTGIPVMVEGEMPFDPEQLYEVKSNTHLEHIGVGAQKSPEKE